MPTSIRTRLLASFLAVAMLSAAGLSLYFLGELESFALRKLEERLYTEARLTAALVAPAFRHSGAEPSATLETSETADLGDALVGAGGDLSSRVRVLDVQGRTLADSTGEPVGTDHSGSPEVAEALMGPYGADTRVLEDGRVALYVAVPVRVSGRVAAIATASATTFSIRTLIWSYRFKLGVLALVFVVVALAAAEMLARWLARPLSDLAATADAFPADHSVRATPSGSRETRAVAEAFNAMAGQVEGVVTELRGEEQRKSRFVSDVSHELRTPLTAIRGAAETLAEGDVPPADADRFLATIIAESDRLTRLTSDLMTLQRIEGATGELPLHRLDLAEVARRAVGALEPLTGSRGVAVEISGSAPAVLGDPDRIQ
ncbi:MAG: HAMP domain-containing protein, partial [Actinobacteria bacterium]